MSKYFKIMQVAYRNIFRSKRRSFFSIFSVSLCVMFIVGMNSIFNGMFEKNSALMQRLFLGHIELASNEYVEKNDDYSIQFPVTLEDKSLEEVLEDIEKIDGVNRALSRITTGIRLDNVHKKNAALWGIDIDRELEFHNFSTIEEGDGLKEGRFPQSKKEVAVGNLLLNKLRLKVGDKIVFKFRSYNGFEKYYKAKIVGTFDFGDEDFNSNYIIIPHNVLHRLAGFSKDQTQKIHVYTDKNSIDKVSKTLKSNYNLTIKKWLDDPFVILFKIGEAWRLKIALTFVIVSAFLLVLTILMVIKERMKEIGIISAMGMSRREIVSMFFYEGAIISIIGGLIGTIIMFIWLFIFRENPLVFSSINPETGLEVVNLLNFSFSIKGILWGFFFVSSISSLISIIPSLKAATIRPIDAIRGE